MSCVKAPETVDVPISIVGRTRCTTSARPMAPASRAQPLHLGGRPGVVRLGGVQPAAQIVGEKPGQIHEPEAPGRILLGQAFTHHGIAELVGNADARRARAKDDHALISQGRSADS